MTGISLASLDATKACDKPFEFEYINPQGEQTGIFFSVLGGQSETVTAEVAHLTNERRRKAAQRATQASLRQNQQAAFEPLENDVEFGQRLAAVRLVGWRGIAEPWSAENALRLCQINRDIASQVMIQSDTIGNFMKGFATSL